MMGLNKQTGRAIDGLTDHVRQSIDDILTTPVGTRVMRRDYGSVIPDLIDQPLNQATTLRLYAATAAAIMKWEPRLKITGIRLDYIAPAGMLVEVSGSIGDTPVRTTTRMGGGL